MCVMSLEGDGLEDSPLTQEDPMVPAIQFRLCQFDT